MIVAVTGASGFIGSHLTAELAGRGHAVRAISRERRREDTSAKGFPIESIAIDYRNGAALERVLKDADVVIHAAGATRAPSRAELEAANVDVTRRVIRAMSAERNGKRRRLVFISSQAATGPAASLQEPVRESDEARPIEAYGETKLAAEQAIRAECGANVDWTVIRPASVYGPRDRDFLQLFRLSSRGVALHPGNREHWISIIHVRDLVEGVIASVTRETTIGRTYHLANDEPTQWRELFRLGATVAQRQLSIDVELPHGLVAIGARVGDVLAGITGTSTLLSSEKLALSRPAYWVCSNSCAKRDFGFGAPTPIAEGFTETHAWYAEHGWL
jgi:nucleoside-diphosphate-sugar epimerase